MVQQDGIDAETQTLSVDEHVSGGLSTTRKSRSRAKARAHTNKMIEAIGSAHRSGKCRKADFRTRTYLASIDARYTAVLEAYRHLKPHRRPDARLLYDYALSLNPWEGTREAVSLWLKEKPADSNGNAGHARTILDFGIENRALQYLVLHALVARADLHPWQYGRRGVHAAINRAAELLATGHVWAIETDIENCYPSFDGEKVIDWIPMPKKVTRSVMLGASFNILLGYPSIFGPADPGEDDELTFAELFADARRGFPQGSATSHLAVEMLLAPLFEPPPWGGTAIGYADNFLAMAKEENDVRLMTSAFWSALEAHPAGQLRPKQPRIFKPGTPIEFLGHILKLINGAVRIDPSRRNTEKFEATLRDGLRKIEACNSYSDHARRSARELRRFVCSWCVSFGSCSGIEVRRMRALQRIDMAIPAV
jgi:hypothetical protein